MKWTPDCQRAFERLKALFTTEPILHHPQKRRKFVIQVDTNDVAMAGLMLQEYPSRGLEMTSGILGPTSSFEPISGLCDILIIDQNSMVNSTFCPKTKCHPKLEIVPDQKYAPKGQLG